MQRTIVLAALTLACSGSELRTPDSATTSGADAAIQPSEAGATADVVELQVSGASGGYTFSVRVSSPDTGCARYADWWEVVDQSGALVYRRILAHSHVDEQPFTRSGGPVGVESDAIVWVRAHMNTGGYGRALRGRPDGEFRAATPPAGFASNLESAAPQPNGCAF